MSIRRINTMQCNPSMDIYSIIYQHTEEKSFICHISAEAKVAHSLHISVSHYCRIDIQIYKYSIQLRLQYFLNVLYERNSCAVFSKCSKQLVHIMQCLSRLRLVEENSLFQMTNEQGCNTRTTSCFKWTSYIIYAFQP